jgi:hypothetical protein
MTFAHQGIYKVGRSTAFKIHYPNSFMIIFVDTIDLALTASATIAAANTCYGLWEYKMNPFLLKTIQDDGGCSMVNEEE